MTHEELLQQLKDIQAPPEPAWWMIAPAYLWTGVTVAILLTCAWLVLRRRRQDRLVRLAQLELRVIHADYRQHGDSRLLAIRLSRWLKQVALLACPAALPQRICGRAWLEFLDQGLADRPFSHGCGRVFAGEVYRRRVELDAEQVIALCERWLRAVRPGLQQRGETR